MRSWQIEAFGSENLRLVEREVPEPGPGEILLRLEAMSLNARDVQMIEGVYNPRQTLPLVPLSDGAGIVEQLGDGVDRFEVGDRVLTMMTPDWIDGEPRREFVRSTLGGPRDGTLQEYLVVSAEGVVLCPEHLPPLEAATLPCAGLTAWNALVNHGSVTAGDTVLALGTGGVSIFALQLASLLGARTIITSSSDEKLARCADMGAWKTINYAAEPGWGRRVVELTAGRGVDLVVEVGGVGTLGESIRAVRIGGTIALIGVVDSRVGPFNVVPVFMRQVRLQGVLVGHRASLEALVRAVEQHRLRPVVDRVFPFEEAPEAVRYLASGAHFGKVCIEISES